MALPYGTNSTLRKERKQQTRENLLAAAAEVFREKGLAGGTVEDIANRAQVSRQTFYIHFDCKEELLLELQHGMEKQLLVHYEHLAELESPSPEQCADWAESLIDLSGENRAIILMLMRTVPFELGQVNTSAYYEQVIILMARRIPAFVPAVGGKDPLIHAKALLLFFELEMMMRYALVENGFDKASVCRAWGEQWSEFVRRPQT